MAARRPIRVASAIARRGTPPPAATGEAKTTNDRFLANEKMDELVAGFNPLNALRVIGKADDKQLDEFGLKEKTDSITVKAGDKTLTNVVAPGDSRGECVPAPDQNPDCTTTHRTGDFTYSKMSDPASPATVAVGDTIRYTVTVTQVGPAAVPGAALVDDLSGVLDDATFVDGSPKATAGTVTRDGAALTWRGDLAVGQVVTVTYAVTVTGGGDTTHEHGTPAEARSCLFGLFHYPNPLRCIDLPCIRMSRFQSERRFKLSLSSPFAGACDLPFWSYFWRARTRACKQGPRIRPSQSRRA